MVQETGHIMAEQLSRIAEECYNIKKKGPWCTAHFYEKKYIYIQSEVSNETIQPVNFKFFRKLLSMFAERMEIYILKTVFIPLIKINSHYEMERLNDEAQCYYINVVYFFSNNNN
jgi:hypothetical protein